MDPDVRRWESNFKKIRIKSVSEDAILAVTTELKKSQQHLMLGIALKSLTGNRKIIEIYEPSLTMRQLPHNRRGWDGSNIRINKAKLSDSYRNEAQSPLRNRCSIG